MASRPIETTVILASFNGADRIGVALDSIRAQGQLGVQVIVVDDGSEPPLATLAPSLREPDIELVRTEKNMGAYSARNLALSRARGEFVALLDDDDEWTSGSLAARLDVLRRRPDATMVHGSVLDCYPDGTELLRRAAPADLRDVLVRDVVAMTTVVARRTAIEAAGRFDASLRRYGDWDLWIRLAQAGPIARSEAVAARVSVRPGSLQHGAIEEVQAAREIVLSRHRALAERLGVRRSTLAYHHAHFAARYYAAGRRERARAEALRSLAARVNVKAAGLLLLSFAPVVDPGRLYFRVKTARAWLAGRLSSAVSSRTGNASREGNRKP